MTVPLAVQAPPSKTSETTTIRKRRRRAPAGGAADDCFTCSKRNVKCDRRRPYCSQCLELGNECSGYKTQLTWGVGVASRGKLRGLSLPIAKAPPVNSTSGISSAGVKKSSVSSPVRHRAESNATMASMWSDREAALNAAMSAATLPSNSPVNAAAAAAAAAVASSVPTTSSMSPGTRRNEIDLSSFQRSPSIPASVAPMGSSVSSVGSYHPAYDLSQMSPSHSVSTPLPVTVSIPVQQHQNWATAGPGALSPFSTTSIPADAIPITNTPQQHPQHHPPHLSASLDSLSDVDYMSPISHSYSREELAFTPSPTAMIYDSFTGHNSPVPSQSPVAAMMIEQRLAPTSCPSLVYAPSEQGSSLASSHPENFDASLSAKLLQECDQLSTSPDIDAFSTSTPSANPFWGAVGIEVDTSSSPLRNEPVTASWPTLLDSQSTPMSADMINKMTFFMDYYENTMCPSMVFIDGPTNPFREHIMQLARGSRSLQHAICALAACNLRMKRKLSLGQHHRDTSEAGEDSSTPDDKSLLEEYQHRNLAVQLLNEQLNDPVKSRHDSVLATILLLSHYRMAESGIARFQTHFAGVKRILSMRRSSPFPPSRDCAWMEALFTYFDAISASINDRETQLNTSFFGVMPDAQLLPQGAENLVGCDRELFRTIIKLGRLNMLSQNRTVQNLNPAVANNNSVSSGSSGNSSNGGMHSNRPMSMSMSMPPPRSQSPHGSGSPMGSPLGALYGGRQPFGSSYGIGIKLEDEDAMGMGSAPLVSPSAFDDHQSTFWHEWKEARIGLQSWEFDPQRLVASLQLATPPTSAQIRDIGSLSEAFRYAALIYTERLASPHAPSSHSSIRNLVSQVVYYATSLESGSSAEKFLLWPLFVAGSECVNELQQNMVRSKCRDIMSRSGYMNNLAALDVLERLWAEASRETCQGAPSQNQGQTTPSQTSNLSQSGPFRWMSCIGGDVEWIMF